MLQGDIFSPVCFMIAWLDRIVKLYDQVNPGVTVGTGAHTVRMAKFEYADVRHKHALTTVHQPIDKIETRYNYGVCS